MKRAAARRVRAARVPCQDSIAIPGWTPTSTRYHWQQAICRQVRSLVHAADPGVVETIKRTRQPYFTLDGNVCALLAAARWVNVFLYDGGIVPDPHGIITGGHHNKTARTVAIREGERVDAPALSAMFRQIIANNRAGGWRKLT